MNLNVNERYVVIGLMNTQKGNLETMNHALKVMDKVSILEEEAKEIGLKQEGQNVVWEKKDHVKDIEFSDEQFTLLNTAFQEKDGKKEWTVQETTPAQSLKDKIDAIKKKEEEVAK